MTQKSKVYFMGLRVHPGTNLLQRLEELSLKAGMLSLDLKKKFTAIKIHFGEPGNLAFIRPNYLSVISRLIQGAGGIPFLTDSNTLYKGRRSNAVDHLQSAMENGFSPATTGSHVIIADGLKGTDFREMRIDQNHCKTAKIGAAVADADVLISVNHFKGHELTGFGGAIKNIGMGCASVGGKLEMHSNSQPLMVRKNCVGCGLCVKNCNYDAIHLDAEKKAVIDASKCVGCGQCVAVCRYNAAQVKWDAKGTQEKIVEYTLAVLQGKPHFHFNFLMNISPNCDCWPSNDMAIVPDIGILASFDPVAIDRASVDLVNQAPIVPMSILGGKEAPLKDKFCEVFPNTNWKLGLEYAEKLDLGTQDYELIEA
jgi:uncharacterized Fe-S center protein